MQIRRLYLAESCGDYEQSVRKGMHTAASGAGSEGEGDCVERLFVGSGYGEFPGIWIQRRDTQALRDGGIGARAGGSGREQERDASVRPVMRERKFPKLLY